MSILQIIIVANVYEGLSLCGALFDLDYPTWSLGWIVSISDLDEEIEGREANEAAQIHGLLRGRARASGL